METQTASDFAQAIRDEVVKGYGFVPLVGAGLSVASGIPVSEQSGDYLCHCIRKAIEDKWSPRDSKWPPLHEASLPLDNQAWMRQTWDSLKASLGALQEDQLLKQEALGALANWRTSLQFLSRIDVKGPTVRLVAPDNRVIDSFFVHITAGREPSIGHMMLAHLADPLRIQTVLTTNFDSLVEDAFARLNIPLATFDVHQKAGLPDAKRVLAQRSIVKLHGGRYGLRADFSLDEPPSRNDEKAFVGYFAAPTPHRTRRHLLIMGVSLRDSHTQGLLRALLQELRDLKVYWVHYGATGGTADNPLAEIGLKKNQLRMMSHRDLGLFLLQLYQCLQLSLPPAGAQYPAFWRVPPLPYQNPKRSIEEKRFQEYCTKLQDAIKEIVGMESQPAGLQIDSVARPKDNLAQVSSAATAGSAAGASVPASNATASSAGTPPVSSSVHDAAPRGTFLKAVVADGAGGVSSAASTVYERLYDKFHCIWIELDDFCGLSDLFVVLTDRIARRLGVPLALPAAASDKPKDYATDLEYYTHLSNLPLVIFLSGRDGPGVSAGWNSDWRKTDECNRFWEFVEAAQPPKVKNVTFVVLAQKPSFLPSRLKNHVKRCSLEERCIKFNVETVVQEVVARLYPEGGIDKKVDKKDDWDLPRARRFIYAMTLFRHSRHAAAICSWGLSKAIFRLRADGGDNDNDRAEECRKYLKFLRNRGATRDKPGGFVWMHSEVRDKLQMVLEGRAVDTSGRLLRELRAECHQGIADWYVKLFRSCGDPLAALESIYHRILCVEHAVESKNDCGTKDQLTERALVEAITTLRLARDQILASGYFKASTNLIHEIRKRADTWGHDRHVRLGELTWLCYELARDFDSEVSNFREAVGINENLLFALGEHAAHGPGWKRASTLPTLQEPELDLMHRQARLLTGYRCYEAAEEEFRKLFTNAKVGLSLSSFHELEKELDSPDDVVRQVRESARRWHEMKGTTPECEVFAIRALRRFMFLEMLIAQILQHNRQSEARTKRLQYSEVIYIAATELMRCVENHEFLQRENAYIRTQYSVLLSNLGRHWEAHRRLNEASAYLARSIEHSNPVTLAVIDLRRAEIYLNQADGLIAMKSDAPDIQLLQRQVLALADDAHVALERAEVRLGARATNVWWRTWLHELQMTVCKRITAVMARRRDGVSGCAGGSVVVAPALPCRNCDGIKGRCGKLLNQGRRLIQIDVLRQARMADLLLDILSETQAKPEDAIALAGAALEHLVVVRVNRQSEAELYPLGNGILEYASGVEKRAAKLVNTNGT